MSLRDCVGKNFSATVSIVKPDSAEIFRSTIKNGTNSEENYIFLTSTDFDRERFSTKHEVLEVEEFFGAFFGASRNSSPEKYVLVKLQDKSGDSSGGSTYQSILRLNTFNSLCSQQASPSTTTPTDGEDPSIPLDEEPVPLGYGPCSAEENSGSPAQQGGAIPAWGVNFEYLDEANEKKSWTLALLPAMQSNTRYSGGTDVPGALPGLSFRTIPSIARHKVPGFQPVYQHMGIDSVTVTMVGCFTGADGVEGTFRPKFDNTNVVLLGSGSDDRKAIIRQLDSYKSFQDFYRLSVQQGRELTVELNLAGGGKFTPSADTLGCTGLRNTRGNPQFKALVKRMDTYYARSDRTWYTIDLEITDYKLISAQPINLLPPAEDPAEEPAPTSPGDSSGSTSGGDTDAGINISGYEGNYETLAGPEYLVRNLELQGIDISEDLYEYEVSQAISTLIKGSLAQTIRRDGGKLILEGSSGEPVVTPIECKDLPPEVLLTLPLKDSKGESKEVEYPCAILGRRGRFGFGRRNREARIVKLVYPSGDPFYKVHEDDIITPEESRAKGTADLILSIVGCVSATGAAITTTIAAFGGGVLGVPATAGASLVAAQVVSVFAWAITAAACVDLGEKLLASGFSLNNSSEENIEIVGRYLAERGENLTWLGLSIWAFFEVAGGWLLNWVIDLFRGAETVVKAVSAASRSPTRRNFNILGHLVDNIPFLRNWFSVSAKYFGHKELLRMFDTTVGGGDLRRIADRLDKPAWDLLESGFSDYNTLSPNHNLSLETIREEYVLSILNELENIENPDINDIRNAINSLIPGAVPTTSVSLPSSPHPSPPPTPATPSPTPTAPAPTTPATPSPTPTAPAPTTTTPRRSRPQPRPAPVFSIPDLTPEQIGNIESAIRSEVPNIELMQTDDGVSLVPIERFINNLKTRTLPDDNQWTFQFTRRPPRSFINLLRNLGFTVDVNPYRDGGFLSPQRFQLAITPLANRTP